MVSNIQLSSIMMANRAHEYLSIWINRWFTIEEDDQPQSRTCEEGSTPYKIHSRAYQDLDYSTQFWDVKGWGTGF